jgi:hypothetical protein
MIRAGLAGIMLLGLTAQSVEANDKPPTLHRLSCALVRYYVARYSAGAAETWARSHGATDAEIDAARKCLPTGELTTVSLSK